MTLLESLLWPLSVPYAAIARLRARAYRTGLLRERRLDRIVISVGNLTTGGTGKTPMVLWIAQRLLKEGKHPGILTRGYRGKSSPGDPSLSGSDEVRIFQARLGDRVPVGVGADRFARGRELARSGVEWFILDDGFQHLQLARDVDIVLIDATNPFGGGHVLPAGRLREPRSALSRADIIIITRAEQAPALEAAIRRDSAAPIFYARPRLDSIRAFRGEHPHVEDSDARSRKFFAFSGIGNPVAFQADLREWGFNIAGQKVFPDHHRYTQADVRAIEAGASAAGADAAICTEKDAFNLSAVRWSEIPLYCCRISMHVDREAEFWTLVTEIAQTRARGSG